MARGFGECRPGALLGVALVLVRTPACWTQQGHLALDARGQVVKASDERAVAWSLIGALLRASALYGLPRDSAPLQAALTCLRRAVGRTDLFGWEETAGRTHEEVVAALRRAIVLAHLHELQPADYKIAA